MLLTKFLFKLAIIFFFAFSLCVSAQEKIDVSKLIAEAAARRTLRDELSDFTFKLSFFVREVSKGKDKTSSMVYDTFTPSKFPAKEMRLPMILVEKDGVPLDENKLEAQRTRLVKQMENVEREAAKKAISEPPDVYPKASFRVDSTFRSDKVWEVDVMQILRGSNFSNSRQISLNGRETIMLDFQARPDFAFTDKMQYFAKLKGNIWIDAADKKVVRMVGFSNAVENVSSTNAEKFAVVSYDLIKVGENLWFLSSAELKTVDFPQIFGKVGMDFKMQFADFKRFRSEAKESTIDAALTKK